MCTRSALLLLCALLLVMGHAQAGTISYQVTTVDPALNGAGEPRVERYTYSLFGFDLLANQEIDLIFDPAMYAALSRAIAPPGFDLILFQPDNPLGTSGHYSALALIDHPVLSGLFSVDFALTEFGIPGAQQFLINQYDQNGAFLRVVSSGVTVSANAAPEPVYSVPFALLLLGGGAGRAVRRRREVTD